MLSGARRTGETGGHTPRKTNSREDNALKHFARPMLLSPLCVCVRACVCVCLCACCNLLRTRPALRYYAPRSKPGDPGYLFGAGKARLKIDRLPITSRKTRGRHARRAWNSARADPWIARTLAYWTRETGKYVQCVHSRGSIRLWEFTNSLSGDKLNNGTTDRDIYVTLVIFVTLLLWLM